MKTDFEFLTQELFLIKITAISVFKTVIHVTVGTTIQSLFLWLRMNVTIHALEMQMKLVDPHGDSLFTDPIKSSIY